MRIYIRVKVGGGGNNVVKYMRLLRKIGFDYQNHRTVEESNTALLNCIIEDNDMNRQILSYRKEIQLSWNDTRKYIDYEDIEIIKRTIKLKQLKEKMI